VKQPPRIRHFLYVDDGPLREIGPTRSS
jgi:hypothetical protein